MYQNMVKSGLKWPGPDMAGYENMAGFRPEPGPDMISGATLVLLFIINSYARYTGKKRENEKSNITKEKNTKHML